MNTSPASVVGILDRLSTGVSRTSIRHYAAPRLKKKKHYLTGFTPGHGERIFVYNHIEKGMIVYSHEPELKRDSQKYLSQIPFTVKKQKPAEIRHDYWQPLCMIQFEAGQGVVGRSVFQKLRELRKLHELQWGWQAKEFQRLNKRERGERLLDQKPNAVADIAAVLAGAGRGNLMWTSESEPVQVEEAITTEGVVEDAEGVSATAHSSSADTQTETKAETSDTTEVNLVTTPSAPAQADATTVEKAPKVGKKKTKEPASSSPKRLLHATIYWSNDMDLGWARKWSDNVIHELGLPEGVRVWNWKTKMVRETDYETPNDKAAKANTKSAPAAGKAAETVQKYEKAKAKKGWFSWLGGKGSGSSPEARA
ncbi:hypothetical protein N0V93_005565 [Gnomoniopsis smithogilvyi]|uniref:Large ribosomal subunit protein mL67 n=1 Tax=Gnomoniopsis smithogilvyi TaxID=1191159 RepID=A0A9W8YVT7_9PEZI|nr:hypothetical protein N0V93_005565 [Gnomoniopsis smithogilvyi]